MRVGEVGDAAVAWARALDAAFAPEAATSVAGGGAAGSIQYLLPRVGKTDFGLFFDVRDAYDQLAPAERVLSHSLLLERGVVLCEPSTRIDGMAGAGLGGGSGWVAIAFDEMRGPSQPHPVADTQPAAEVRHAA